MNSVESGGNVNESINTNNGVVSIAGNETTVNNVTQQVNANNVEIPKVEYASGNAAVDNQVPSFENSYDAGSEVEVANNIPPINNIEANNTSIEQVNPVNNTTFDNQPISSVIQMNSVPTDVTNTNQTINNVPQQPVNNETQNNMQQKVVEYEFDEVNTREIDYIEETRNESYFDGKMLEYLAYCFLRGFIIGLTAGVGKPWADVIFYEYKCHHTIYNGKRLKFTGKATDLFAERFRWIFLAIITFGIYIFWIPLKKQKWFAQHTFFEDEEAILGESYFDGKLLPLLGVNLLTKVLSAISFGLLIPFAMCYKERWLKKHTIIARKRIVFNGKSLRLFGNMLKWIFLSAITFGIYGLWVPVKKNNWFAKNTSIRLRAKMNA